MADEIRGASKQPEHRGRPQYDGDPDHECEACDIGGRLLFVLPGAAAVCAPCVDRFLGAPNHSELDRIAELIRIWEDGDEPEGAPSPSRTLYAIRDVIRGATTHAGLIEAWDLWCAEQEREIWEPGQDQTWDRLKFEIDRLRVGGSRHADGEEPKR